MPGLISAGRCGSNTANTKVEYKSDGVLKRLVTAAR